VADASRDTVQNLLVSVMCHPGSSSSANEHVSVWDGAARVALRAANRRIDAMSCSERARSALAATAETARRSPGHSVSSAVTQESLEGVLERYQTRGTRCVHLGGVYPNWGQVSSDWARRSNSL